jgi:hypothetical protein
MKLEDFPYLTTSEFADYSTMITNIIAKPLIELLIGSLIGTITTGGKVVIPHGEDRLAYWDTSANICFGRYLMFTNVKNKTIPFWLGLDSTPWEARYIIWFEKKDITAYVNNLKQFFDPLGQYEKSVKEVWIILDYVTWENFCKSASPQQRSDIIKDFLVSVLGKL